MTETDLTWRLGDIEAILSRSLRLAERGAASERAVYEREAAMDDAAEALSRVRRLLADVASEGIRGHADERLQASIAACAADHGSVWPWPRVPVS